MRRILLVLLFLAAVMAVEIDEATGCEKYTDHVICPQETDIETEITYKTDTSCFSIQNEFGNLEEMGCYAEVELAKPLEYQSCDIYIPFDENDIKLAEIDYEYRCSTEKVDVGTKLYVMGYPDNYEGCSTVEEDEYYGEYLCPTEGARYSVTGGIFYDGNYTLMLYTQEKYELGGLDVASPILWLVILVLLIYAAYVWTERKK